MIYYTDDNLKNFSIRKAVSKESVMPLREEQVRQEQEEFQHKWHIENTVISRIVRFGNELGYLPSLRELYRSGRFTSSEFKLEAVRHALQWLLRGPIRYTKKCIVDASNSALCSVIQLVQEGEKYD